MITMKKCLVFSVAEVAGILFVLVMFKSIRHKHFSGMCQNVGAGMDERLKESKSLLEKAAVHLQSAFEHLKNMKQ